MNKKKIMKIVVASALAAGSVTFNNSLTYADELPKESESEAEVLDNTATNEDAALDKNKQNSNDFEVIENENKVEKADSKSVQKGKIVNVTTNLRIRSQPSTSSSILGYLLNGTEVSIISQSGDFYKITYQNVTGYVHKDYVQVISGNTTNSSSSINGSSGKVVNVSTSLNVRSGPGTTYRIIGQLKNGQSVTITGESGNFFAINFNGQTGYVSKDYVSKGSSSSSTQTGGNSSVSTSRVGTVVNVSTNLRVRSSASTSSTVLGYLLNGQSVTITGESGNFFAINFNGITGYVSKDYISVGSSGTSSSNGNSSSNKTGIVIASALNVRSGASTSNSIIGTLNRGSSVTITGESGNFYKINYNGQSAYVSKDYVQVGGGSSSSQSSKYSTVLSNMKSQLGTPYCWGGYGQLLTTESLRTLKATFPTQAANGAYSRVESYVNKGYRAFDCSGLMQWGFAKAGISLGRTTWDQIKNGTEVSLNNLQPGDLLFYSNLQHVGMYIGNGQWIESPNKNANIRITNVPWSLIGRARRVL